MSEPEDTTYPAQEGATSYPGLDHTIPATPASPYDPYTCFLQVKTGSYATSLRSNVIY